LQTTANRLNQQKSYNQFKKIQIKEQQPKKPISQTEKSKFTLNKLIIIKNEPMPNQTIKNDIKQIKSTKPQ